MLRTIDYLTSHNIVSKFSIQKKVQTKAQIHICVAYIYINLHFMTLTFSLKICTVNYFFWLIPT